MTLTNEGITRFNKAAWNKQVETGNQWTIPVGRDDVANARKGEWSLVLTPSKSVPREWFPAPGAKILGLASGGGQQGPILAAAGYDVTIFDNSPLQLARDEEVAKREGLEIRTIEGDMADLSVFADATFDFIFHPCSNCFVPDVNPVWREAFRVLKRGGSLVTGFVNPVAFTLDVEREKAGEAVMKYRIPYSDIESLTAEERIKFFGEDEPYTFGHSLEDQIGGQLRAGFRLADMYEDDWPTGAQLISQYIKAFIATQAIKP